MECEPNECSSRATCTDQAAGFTRVQSTLDEMAGAVSSSGLDMADPARPPEEADAFIGTMRTVILRQILGAQDELTDRFSQTLPDCSNFERCPRRLALVALQRKNS